MINHVHRRNRLKPWVAPALAVCIVSAVLVLGGRFFAAAEDAAAEPVVAPEPEVVAPAEAPPEPQLTWETGSFRDKPFYNAMQEQGLRADQVHNLIDALTPFYDFRRAHPRHEWRLGSRESTPVRFELHVSAAEIYDVEGLEGTPTATRRPIETLTTETVVRAELTSSLYGALQDQPDHANLAMKLANVFAYEIDFYQDPRAGDRFELLVEQQFIRRDGELVFHGWGRILAARYHGARETALGYLFDQGEDPGYYDLEGKSLVRDVLRSPLKLQRITSTFKKRRFHPILKRWKPHNGVDYGVPRGTPVMAVADGKVTVAGRYGGAGNAVVLSHRRDMETQYFHLDRFAKGVRKGGRVKQGQVVGYVGKSGLATWYHLHFGMKIRGKYVNPLDQKFQPGPPISQKYRAAFEALTAEYQARLDARPLEEAGDPLVLDPGLAGPYLPKQSRLDM